MLAMMPFMFPMPRYIAMPMARLYCPARLFPILKTVTSGPFTCAITLITHQATVPEKAAYSPEMHKNVPKYFAPIDASEILIKKPTSPISRHTKRNGERILTWSDHDAKTIRSATIVGMRPEAMNDRGLLTCAHIRWDR